MKTLACASCGKVLLVPMDSTAFGAASVCKRCGCDLSALVKLQALSDELCSQSAVYLAEREYEQAYSFATSSWELRNSSESARLSFLACLGLRNFQEASDWYQRGGRNPG